MTQDLERVFHRSDEPSVSMALITVK